MAEYTYVGGALAAQCQGVIRDVPDFPKPGIVFKDIAPLVGDTKTFRAVTQFFVDRYRAQSIEKIVAVESRGFLFGAPLAYALGVPLHMARKKGKLPFTTVEQHYDLEYGSATIELHTDAVARGERVLIIDDLLATGGTVAATTALVEQLGGQVAECAFLIELGFLNGREKLGNYSVMTIVKYA
jgi:adenine phosphoribosyltransferase